MAPQKQWLSEKMVPEEEKFRKYMKEKSVKVPALKGLLDRPLDLGCVELMERATNWSSLWGKAFRSLKPHGSSPERVLDLLCFLDESSDEKMRQTDLDDVTMEHLTAARSALQEVIREVELAVKKGGLWWNPWQLAPWLRYWRRNAPWSCLGSEDLPELRAMDARASMLMTRLKDEEEESKRQAMTSQLQQLQSECEHLRKKQEESECERLKERQALTSQMQEIQSECESLRKRQEESERERLKEESQRQAITLQLQALQLQQLQSEKLKKKESKFNSLVARAQSLKSKVEQFCNECEKCDAEDASSDSSWELCTVMTEGSGISVDTAGRCFMREAVFKAEHGGFVCGQDLRKGSKILAADGSIVEVAHPPEVSEKRGKVVLQTDKAKLEVTADHRVVNVTPEGAQQQVPALELAVGDLVLVDNQPESLTHKFVDEAMFKVLQIGFSPDKPVEAFTLPPMIQSHGHKIAKCRRGGRRRGRRTRAGDDDVSIPDTQGDYLD